MPLRWFRRKKSDETAPLTRAEETPELDQLTVPAPEGEGEDGQSTTDAARKRRRGTRGGRGRKKTTAPGGTATATSATATQAETRTSARKSAERKPAERKTRTSTSQTRRRTAPKRAPLPKAKRELLVSVDAGEKRVAVLEDDKVAEVYLERPERRSIAGNIYLGVVDNVLPGMEAAFVEIGLEKNGFLYVDEIIGPELEGNRKSGRKITDLIQRGEKILVQAVKDPMKTKGARLTTEISLPGRFVVYVPHGEGLGVSRRLEDEERTRLKAILKEHAPKKGGVIVRTAAEGASADDIERDLDFLQRLWKSIEAKAETAKSPSLVYQESELPLRVVRDLFTGDFERLLVDHDRTHKRIVGYLRKTSPHMAERVTRYKEREPLMEAFGVEQEIKSTLSRRVDLPSGGYLIFDYAEAFTVIDVNTGRYVGSRSKKSGGRLEDTITKNNLEAVKEVVRQLRLRDIGGIIVIDFIDMASPKNRAAVEQALGEELERDRTKTYVVEISPLGLVEMTRQNVTDGPREIMTKKCPTCGGDGIVVSDHTAAVDVERRLRALVTPGSRDKAFKVEVASRIGDLVVGPGGTRLRELEETTKRRFFVVGKDGEHLDHFRVLERGTLEKVAPSLPFDVGAEIEVKLGEVGLYDARAGAGKVGDVTVSVADAAKLVGKKVKVRITAVTDGTAWAELVTPAEAADEPLTAEAEAEKPTRAKRATSPRRKGDDAEGPEDEAPEDDDLDAVADEEDFAPDETAEGDSPAAPKKKTRRGSRGGRNRKKKTETATTGVAAAAETNGAEAVASEEEEAAPVAPVADEIEPAEPAEPLEAEEDAAEPVEEETAAGPVIHVPDRELGDGDDDAPAKKKTRRGSRGGRNRKKKTATADAAGTGAVAVEDETAPAETEEPSQNGEPEWGYTPMSQWGLDESE